MLISTNILRDENLDFDYIVTENSQSIFDSIWDSKKTHKKCFNLIGSYGTGKSSFLLAFEQTLRGNKLFFDRPIKKTESSPRFIKLIGTHNSILVDLRKSLKLNSNAGVEAIIEKLKKEPDNRETYLIIDELGKYIEYALTNNPKKETYVFQRLAEFINDSNNNIFWIGTLHQNIDRYAHNVDEIDSLEWEKVSGRFDTLNFNEPPSSILKLIAPKIESLKISSGLRGINAANKVVKTSNLLPEHFINNSVILKKSCKPFDALTAFFTISLLQKYGQNERSIFTFLSAKGQNSLLEFSNEFYNPSELFEYSVNKLGHILFSSNNPDKLLWEASERAIQRSDSHKEINPSAARIILRTILFSNIFCKEGSSFKEVDLKKYVCATLGISNDVTVDQLIDKNIIQYLKHRGKMVFVEGTDVNLKAELINASKLLNSNIDYTSEIANRISLAPSISRSHLLQTGAPRFFHYTINTSFDNIDKSKGKTNGLCHIVLGKNNDIKSTDIEEFPEIYVQITDNTSLDSLMREILLYELILEKYQDDLIVKQLVANERDHSINQLKQELKSKCYDSSTLWHTPGKEKHHITSEKEANNLFTQTLNIAYNQSPIIQNELINRSNLSVTINSARKNIIRALNDRLNTPDLGFTTDKFPAHKSIFISTWVNEGLYDQSKGELKNPTKKSSYYSAWNACNQFLDQSNSGKISISNLYDLLEASPFGMKRGLLNYWIPLYLITKEDEYALYYGPEDKYLPYLSIDIFDSLIKKPHEFLIKKFSFKGVSKSALAQYKEVANIGNDRTNARSTYLGIFTNFILLHRSLNKYALTTKKMSAEAISLREAIGNAPDPETALFNTIPAAIGFPQLSQTEDDELIGNYFKKLSEHARELAGCYNQLLDRIEESISEGFNIQNTSFEELKKHSSNTLSDIKPNTLSSNLRVTLERICSPLDDRESWLKSIADAILGYSLESLADENEASLHKNIDNSIKALISHKNLTSKPKGSSEVSITKAGGVRINSFISPISKEETKKLNSIISELDSEMKLKLISVILESEKELAEWNK